jgi:hypothetical protein
MVGTNDVCVLGTHTRTSNATDETQESMPARKQSIAMQRYASEYAARMAAPIIWGNAFERSEHERAQQVAPFQAWVVEQRNEIELRLMRSRRALRELAPLAQAAMDAATTPASCGLVVIDLAHVAAECVQLEDDFALFNAFYADAADPVSDLALVGDCPSETIRALWQRYQAEQDAKE